MINKETFAYRGPSLSVTTEDVGFLPVMESTILSSVSIRTKTNVVSDTVFSVKKNGVEIATVTIAAGTLLAGTAGIMEDLLPDDVLTVDLVSGAATSPICFSAFYNDGIEIDNAPDFAFRGEIALDTDYRGNDCVRQNNKLYICNLGPDAVFFYDSVIPDLAGEAAWTLMIEGEDGESGGTVLPAGDLNATTNTVEKLAARTLYLPSAVSNHADDFTNALTEKWTVVSGTSSYAVALESASAKFTLGSGNGSSNLTYKTPFNLTDKYAQIDLTAMQFLTGGSANQELHFNLSSSLDAAAGANFTIQGNGQLVARHYPSNAATVHGTSASAYSKLRYRYSTTTGLLYWEAWHTASAAWVEIRSQAPAWAVTNIYPVIIAFGWGGGGTSGRTFHVDNFVTDSPMADPITDKSVMNWNAALSRFEATALSSFRASLLGTGSDINSALNQIDKIQGRTVSIPANTALLSDDFNDNVINTAMWQYTPGNTNSTVTETGGTLNFAIGTPGAYSSFKSVQKFSFVNKTLTFDLTIPASVTAEQFTCSIILDANNSIGFDTNHNNELYARYKNAGVSTQILGVSYPTYKIVKIRLSCSAANLFKFEVYENGVWVTKITQTVAWSMASVYLEMSAGSYSGTHSGTSKYIVDNLVSDVSLADPLADKSLLGWNGVSGRFEDYSPSRVASLVFNSATVPATSTSAGSAGQVAYDANYLYLCVAANNWKRIALSTF